jgi:cation diffusion facilitator family transporter
MSDCGCHSEKAMTTAEERRTIRIALYLNAAMFVVGTTAGLIAHSSGLLADALDMLADASAYGIALLAIERSDFFKQRAATLSGLILMILGLSVIADVIRRAVMGSEPEGWLMMAAATLSLIVNTIVLRMLARYRSGEVHLRATWIFTRADVVANIGVIIAGLLVLAVRSRIPDLVIGFCIGVYVIKEAAEILRISGKRGDARVATQ